MSQSSNLEQSVALAAVTEGDGMTFAEARNSVAAAIQEAKEVAEAKGVKVRVFGAVTLDDGSAGWAAVLAELLATTPSKAKLKNATLAALLTGHMELCKAFDAKRFSKPLSRSASDEAAAILAAHGYRAPIRRGSDIKRAVLGGKESAGRVRYTATGIEIDGRAHKYKQRERMATGLPHSDLSIRIAGADVPLVAALALLGVGVGEFMAGDAAAVARATLEELTKRAEVLPPAKVAKSIRDLQDAVRESAEKHHAMTLEAWASLRNARPWLPEYSTLSDAFQPSGPH